MSLKVGTRGSRLALAQTATVIKKIQALGIEVEQKIISTQGDEVTGVPLHAIGKQGVFVRALDDAILRGEIDCAVHSMKDIPAIRPSGLITSAILTRDSPADFLAFSGPVSAVRIIGTSSTRRRAQLLRHDPSLEIKDLRGNVDTRVRKLSEGHYNAIVLAEAGLSRLGIRIPGERLPPEKFVPTPNQGTIAVVSRADPSIMEVLASIDHPATRKDVAIERAVMEQVGAGCFTPMGIYCRDGNLIAEVLSLDGKRTERIEKKIGTLEEARTEGSALRVRAGTLIADAYHTLGISL
ncbi:MAG: hydroxymethylbilane synthase [Methanoregula sp.]|uniref:hydroxymethylbilane synthase n=1 Tax=Methanoregula sp. TaxID=2052170 RepID=UPI003BAFDE38